MKCTVIGLGTQGRKRIAVAGGDVVATVDPVQPDAQYSAIEQVPLDIYDSGLVCTPDQSKFGILSYLLSHGKHVLVEKPLLDLGDEQLAGLADSARCNGAVCYTAYNHRFEPHIMRLKELLDSGELGQIYTARLFYGNGTSQDVRSSPWRDQGTGVLADLGSHLLDTVLFLFGEEQREFSLWSASRYETRSFDHVIFGAKGTPGIELEATLLSWRNTFKADIIGENGSAHIDCLCKWGPSTFTLRTRILPSGIPSEETEVLEQPDPTWHAEYQYFTRLCRTGGTNLENDRWINSVLNQVSQSMSQEAIQ